MNNTFAKKTFYTLSAILMAGSTYINVSHAALPNPTERIEYWQGNYTALSAIKDDRVKQANLVFKRILQAAGNRPGIEPRLLVIEENPLNISLPVSIPDGWIILSNKVLDVCYKDKQYGNDRLAFVLAHEVAHQLENDFWHMKFFQTMSASRSSNKKVVRELQDIARQSNKIRAKELRADELGIIYAMMAGYDVNTIVGKNADSTFFDEWLAALNPERLANRNTNRTHPTARQRATAVRARLEQVADKGDLFNLGLLFYQTGDFKHAIQSFDRFKKYYPGREVYLNLGASHHNLAMQYYRHRSKGKGSLPLRTSVAIDPLNRASKIANRSVDESSREFKNAIDHAISNYKKAISLDPENIIAYNNIASAYILLEQPYKAISHLQDAERIQPSHALMLNNMGVAFHMVNNPQTAIKYLNKAKHQGTKNNYVTPLYNLGVIAHQNGNNEKAEQNWQAYLSKDSDSAWARLINKALGHKLKSSPSHNQREKLAGLEVGTYFEEIPTSWGKQPTKAVQLGSSSFSLTRYPNGVTTLAESREVRILTTQTGFSGKTARGVRIGHSERDVLRKYGSPEQTYLSTRGKSLAYLSEGITIQTADGKVTGWILFWD